MAGRSYSLREGIILEAESYSEGVSGYYGDRVEMRLYFADVEATKVLPIADGYYPIWVYP